MIRVMLVDDHPVLRYGMAGLIDTQDDLSVVAQTGDVDEVIRLAATQTPDVVLMDLDLGAEISGIDLTARLRAESPGTRVLVFTTYDTDADIVRAIEAGATGYFLKDSRPADLFAAIRSAAAGISALSPTIATRLLGRTQKPDETLTAREIEVLELLARGYSNKELGHALFVSEGTVKSHLHHIYTKLRVDSRGAAIAHAVREGIVRL
ncbi:response regulator transcription factor [Microbacterium sp. KSW4-16]|uniref:Response regulator transcription factor n=1 Tax=Microbacterium aurugineum TaxID=2851642 RepID=A0ABY4IXQ3_9MICO|nr:MULTISPECIES: response regulator transcription factor [Microbacterium]PKQ33258.1 MAG: DNA-binding response regulator [Actinobacteria bacterium HGW-Actinobacteria-11]MCK8467841.1 response regulator transcription factor [Microbacterium aurugineum]MCZ4303018.1 response regulator transcription factor [Microbacterium oxydans]TFB16416.1 response regulator transcription factor [Microbacterium sp. 3H14]UPL16253.1 response regulator transcription factor [Microbacterium aurugineum]